MLIIIFSPQKWVLHLEFYIGMFYFCKNYLLLTKITSIMNREKYIIQW